MAALLALLSSVLWGTGDFLGGTVSRRLRPLAVVGGSQLAGLLAVAVYAAAIGAYDADRGYLPWAIAAGTAGLVGLVAFYGALATGTMGVVAPIAALGAVVPVAAGLLGGDAPSVLQAVGIVVALAGVVLASGPELSGAAGSRPVLLALVAALSFGLVLLCVARGSRSDPTMTLVAMRATTVPIVAVIALVARNIGGIRSADAPGLVVIGLFDAGANLAFAVASTGGYLSVVAVLGSLYPVVTAVLARIVHAERLRPVQQAGVGAAIAGIVLIAAG